MKVKVKTDYCGCRYITAGKYYDADVLEPRGSMEDDPGYLLSIIDDDGDMIISCELRSFHLDGHNFEVLD